jgi:hypothetical protein
MLLPTSITPSALGLHWGMSREQCLEVLDTTPQWEGEDTATCVLVVSHLVDVQNYQFRLFYKRIEVPTEASMLTALIRIDVALLSSHLFWNDEILDGGNLNDVLDRVWQEFSERYAYVVTEWSKILGEPESRDGFWAEWRNDQGHLEIWLDQEDKELPIEIRASYAQLA